MIRFRAGYPTTSRRTTSAQPASASKSPLPTAQPLLPLSSTSSKTRTSIPLLILLLTSRDMNIKLSTLLYIRPRYVLGHSLSLGALVLCLITVCAQMMYCHWENRKRERGDRDERLLLGAEHLLGHRHPAFRYTL